MAKITEAVANVDLEMYKMNLNDSVRVGGLEITRVPGGWVYAWAIGKPDKNMPLAMSMVFVPFNDEFNPNLEQGKGRCLNKNLNDLPEGGVHDAGY